VSSEEKSYDIFQITVTNLNISVGSTIVTYVQLLSWFKNNKTLGYEREKAHVRKTFGFLL
jgi:hypothetical protein